jgi:hypothetical protein
MSGAWASRISTSSTLLEPEIGRRWRTAHRGRAWHNASARLSRAVGAVDGGTPTGRDIAATSGADAWTMWSPTFRQAEGNQAVTARIGTR